MGLGTANKYTRRLTVGTLTHSKPLVPQKSIPHMVVSHMTKFVLNQLLNRKCYQFNFFFFFFLIKPKMQTCKVQVSSTMVGFKSQI